MGDPRLSDAEVLAYRRDGFVVVKNLVPEPVTLDALVAIDGLLCARDPHLARSERSTVRQEIHGKICDLAARDRAALASVYDAIRKVAPFWAMVGGEELVSAVRQLLSSESPGVIFRGCGIRLDLPGEDKWRSAWHQEYHSQMSSVRGVTAWFGLVPVTTQMGPVELLPGSHERGVLPVRCPDPMNVGKNYTETFVLDDVDDLLTRYTRASTETEVGDVVFLDFLTVHQSGHNRDPLRSRVTCQARYFDMLEKEAVDHGWTGGWQEGGDFRKRHPEKVVAGSDSPARSPPESRREG